MSTAKPFPVNYDTQQDAYNEDMRASLNYTLQISLYNSTRKGFSSQLH
jgi:hypothetical protein